MPAAIEAKVFQDKNTVAIARNLLGKLLVRAQADGTVERRRIVEVEAYHGTEDLACHAARGRTARTEVMFAPGGVWYVYLCYGIHELLNLVTGPADHPAAVLIRGVDTVSGPGRLTRALGIDRRLNGRPAEPASGLWLEDDGFFVARRRIVATPRIGVDYAGPVWSAKKWRFTIASTSVTSRPARSGPRRSG
jgi:DNA-3-methyladenine glycosylase